MRSTPSNPNWEEVLWWKLLPGDIVEELGEVLSVDASKKQYVRIEFPAASLYKKSIVRVNAIVKKRE